MSKPAETQRVPLLGDGSVPIVYGGERVEVKRHQFSLDDMTPGVQLDNLGSMKYVPIYMSYRGEYPGAAGADLGVDDEDDSSQLSRNLLTPRRAAESDSINPVASPITLPESANSSAGGSGDRSGTSQSLNRHLLSDLGLPGSSFVDGWRNRTCRERLRYLSYYFPVSTWLPEYNPREYLLMDMLAGLSVGTMLVPQAIAYSSLVGIEPLYGLTSAFLAKIVYFMFGHSRVLSVGPEATTSILLGQAVFAQPQIIAARARGDPDLPTLCSEFAASVTIITGVLTLLLGVFRLGFVDTVFSRPVLSGFVTAVGMLLILEQLPNLFGLPGCSGDDCENDDLTTFKIKSFFRNIGNGNVNWRAFLISFFSVSFLFLAMYVKRKFPNNKPLQLIPQVFIIVIFMTIISYGADLRSFGVAVLGSQDRGFPSLRLPFLSSDRLSRSLATAITLTIVGFVETQLVNKTVTPPKSRVVVSANRELVALGIGHVINSCFGGYAAFGSLTRTKVSVAAGTGSQIASLVAAIIVLFTMLFMLPLFSSMPLSVTASIIFYVGCGLLEVKELKFTFKMRQWMDFGLNIAMIVITFFFGVDAGIFFAFAACLLLVVRQQNKPSVRLMGLIKKAQSGRTPKLSRYGLVMGGGEPELNDDEPVYEVEEGADVHKEQLEGILIYRIDGPLFFSNAEGLKDRTRRIEYFGNVISHPSEPVRPLSLKGIIFDFASVSAIDSSAAQALLEIISDYKERKVRVLVVKLRASVQSSFERAGIVEAIGASNFFRSTSQAVLYLHKLTKSSSTGEAIPGTVIDDKESSLSNLGREDSRTLDPVPVPDL